MIQKRINAETDDVIAIEQNCDSSTIVVPFKEMRFFRR
jgi:hypothetical protein